MTTMSEKEKLATCDSRLVAIFDRVKEMMPCLIIEGHRGEARQDMLWRDGKSKLRFPNSKHNSVPSLAVDAAPQPLDWADREQFIYFAGHVMAIAREMGVKLRWGGDWNGNGIVKDEKFQDLVHFEIVE